MRAASAAPALFPDLPPSGSALPFAFPLSFPESSPPRPTDGPPGMAFRLAFSAPVRTSSSLPLILRRPDPFHSPPCNVPAFSSRFFLFFLFFLPFRPVFRSLAPARPRFAFRPTSDFSFLRLFSRPLPILSRRSPTDAARSFRPAFRRPHAFASFPFFPVPLFLPFPLFRNFVFSPLPASGISRRPFFSGALPPRFSFFPSPFLFSLSLLPPLPSLLFSSHRPFSLSVFLSLALPLLRLPLFRPPASPLPLPPHRAEQLDKKFFPCYTERNFTPLLHLRPEKGAS